MQHDHFAIPPSLNSTDAAHALVARADAALDVVGNLVAFLGGLVDAHRVLLVDRVDSCMNALQTREAKLFLATLAIISQAMR